MSPDPPRSEEEVSSGTVYFMQEEDDFMDDPNGEHVLDFSDHESDFSDDADGNNNGEPLNAPENDNQGTDSDQRIIARYQLLIPFPAAENPLESSETENEPDLDQDIYKFQDMEHESSPSSIPVANSDETRQESKANNGASKREIILTDDKLEIIKNAMQGFTLPSSSIPQWVQQVDENSWKDRLIETLHQKSSK